MPRATVSIDLLELERLAGLHCTTEEAASFLGVCDRTLRRRLKQPAYAEAWERGRGKARISLRREQWRAAKRGNVTMLIWLGKQILGQRDAPIEVHDYSEVDRWLAHLKSGA